LIYKKNKMEKRNRIFKKICNGWNEKKNYDYKLEAG
jgi:hypothetical protein